jgi:hypothetical protein
MPLTGNPYILPTDLPKSGVGGSLRFAVANGAASGVAITVAEMTPADTIAEVLEFPAGGGLNDRTANVTSVDTGSFKLNVATTGSRVRVTWLDKV